MAKPPGGSSCSIFVGNVPYDADEAELKDLFGKVGQVTSVRVVVDKDTKQPKGYAFCDFVDSSSVQLAITQLNNVEYNGRRLRIDWAERELNREQGGVGGERGGERHGGGGGRGGPPGGPSGPGGGPEPPPLAAPVPTVADRLARLREQEATEQARVLAQDAAERAEIARLMETLTPMQLFNIVGEMQRLAIRAPEVARALVGENLQLCLALQHAQFLIGMTEEPPLPTKPEVRETARNVRQRMWVPDEEPARPVTAPAAQLVPTFMLGQSQPGLPPMPPAMRPAKAPGPPSGPQDKGFLESLVSLSPGEIDQLEHGTKMRLLEYLQTI